MKAACDNSLAVAKLLIEMGAQVNNTNNDGRTALILGGRHIETVKLLLQNGAQINKKCNLGRHVLFTTFTDYKTPELANLLISSGAEVDVIDVRGETVLHLAAYANNLELVKLFIEKGANVNYQNKSTGQTALLLVMDTNSVEVAKLLIESGAQVDIKDDEGQTALLLMANLAGNNVHADYHEMIKLLIKSGAQTQMTNGYGQTAMDIALVKNHQELARLLRHEERKKKSKKTEKASPDLKLSEDVEGFKGNQDIADLLKFIGNCLVRK